MAFSESPNESIVTEKSSVEFETSTQATDASESESDSDVFYRPGCFGSAVCYKPGTPICDACPFIDSCGPVALARKAFLKDKFAIREERPNKKTEVFFDVVDLFLQDLDRQGIDLSLLKSGKCPFDKRPDDLTARVAFLLCLVYLSRKRSNYDRIALFQKIKDHLDSDASEADVLRSFGIVVEAFSRSGIADRQGNRLVFRF